MADVLGLRETVLLGLISLFICLPFEEFHSAKNFVSVSDEDYCAETRSVKAELFGSLAHSLCVAEVGGINSKIS